MIYLNSPLDHVIGTGVLFPGNNVDVGSVPILNVIMSPLTGPLSGSVVSFPLQVSVPKTPGLCVSNVPHTIALFTYAVMVLPDVSGALCLVTFP